MSLLLLDVLARLVRRQAVGYRKGEVVRVESYGAATVTTVDAFETTPARGALVDVHFINVGFTEAAADRDGFLTALHAALRQRKGYYADLSVEDFRAGPSYIAVGAWIGDQTLALLLFGLLKFHGVGDVITPASLGITDSQADELAGNGFVMGILTGDLPAGDLPAGDLP